MRKGLRKIFGSAFTIGALAIVVMLAGSARADVFNTTLATPPGTYFGTGNSAGGWTVNTTSSVEVGLRAKYRFGAEIDTPTDVYDVLAGPCIIAPCNQSGNKPALALWNFDYSINLAGTGLTLPDVAQYTILTIEVWDGLTQIGTTQTIKPLVDITDNWVIGGDPNHVGRLAGNNVAQNSENPGWFIPGFDPNAGYLYEIALDVRNSSNVSLASTEIDVQVSPEPSAVILLGTALLGAFVMARRRRTA